MIYFLRCTVTGLVKVGFSKDLRSLKERLKPYSVCSPTRLDLVSVIDGDLDEEARWHVRFRDHHHHGEWFAVEPDRLPASVLEVHRVLAVQRFCGCGAPAASGRCRVCAALSRLPGPQGHNPYLPRTGSCHDCEAPTKGHRCTRCCNRDSKRRWWRRRRHELGGLTRTQAAACDAIGLSYQTYRHRREVSRLSHDEAIALGVRGPGAPRRAT